MNIIRRMLMTHLPNKIKRLFCLATFACFIAKPETFETEKRIVKLVDATLNVAENEGAMLFATRFTNLIWKGIHVKKSNADPDTLIYHLRELYIKLPNWMKYSSSESEILDELRSVVEVLNSNLNLKIQLVR